MYHAAAAVPLGRAFTRLTRSMRAPLLTFHSSYAAQPMHITPCQSGMFPPVPNLLTTCVISYRCRRQWHGGML